MNNTGCQANYFKSDDISILGSDCGVPQFPQFYDKNNNKYGLITGQSVGSYLSEKELKNCKKYGFLHQQNKLKHL